MLDIIGTLFEMFWVLLKWPLFIGGAIFGVMFILFFCNAFYFRYFKKMVKPTGEHYRIKQRNFFQKLFIDAPRQMALDYMNRNPEFFKYQGVIIFCGPQGSGKTCALIRETRLYQQEFPRAKVLGNLSYKYQDDVLDHWTKLVDYKNGIQGVIVQMDETQNWFSSNQSKDFPPQMLEVITQNRKNRRVILGTAQSFNRLAKPIREQTTEVRECHTFLGCITLVIRKRPKIDFEGNVEKMKYLGHYWFVHDEELRNSYDTYRVVESLRESGFQPVVNSAGETTTNNIIVMDKKTAKKMK